VANKIINQLIAIRGLKLECPKCINQFPIKKANLFSMSEKEYPSAAHRIINRRLEQVKGSINGLKERKLQLEEDKKKPLQIRTGAQASNFGNICEQIIPALLAFPYKHNECRALFKPVDYVLFSGLSEETLVERIKFVDVKTGKGSLTKKQEQIRDRVSNGKVKHRVID
jgi:predicted Holliday junction resolvase-like endonuclease